MSALAQNPWAVSAWYWSKYPKTGNGLSFNQYAVKVMQDEDFVRFSVGLPYVCEAFTYGTATSEADSDNHQIARGQAEDYLFFDDNYAYCIKIDINNVVEPSIERYTNLYYKFEQIKDFLE